MLCGQMQVHLGCKCLYLCDWGGYSYRYIKKIRAVICISCPVCGVSWRNNFKMLVMKLNSIQPLEFFERQPRVRVDIVLFRCGIFIFVHVTRARLLVIRNYNYVGKMYR